MVKKIGIGVAVLVALLLVVAAVQPATFHFERSRVVQAPPEVVFAQVNDLHAWEPWNPFGKMDASEKLSYSGAAQGVGAVMRWTGNDKVGEGSMTIEQSEAPKHVGIKLEFIKPFQATNQATFTFVPEGAGTKVTWAMDGNNSFVGKLIHLVVSNDAMLGPPFEKGLEDLAKVSEAAAKKQAEAKAAPTEPAP